MTYLSTLIRRFYPKRLTIAFRLYIFISTCVPWESNPQPFCAADAMLYHWATQEHCSLWICSILFVIFIYPFPISSGMIYTSFPLTAGFSVTCVGLDSLSLRLISLQVFNQRHYLMQGSVYGVRESVSHQKYQHYESYTHASHSGKCQPMFTEL